MREHLNLGCGTRLMRSDSETGVQWWNVDMLVQDVAEGIEYVRCDLQQGIPFTDGHFDHVLCDNVLEHFVSSDAIHLLNEMDRVLKIGGTALIIVPHALSQSAFQDPTHVSFWVPRSALYWNQYTTPYGGRRVGITANFRTDQIILDGDPSTEWFIKFYLTKVRE